MATFWATLYGRHLTSLHAKTDQHLDQYVRAEQALELSFGTECEATEAALAQLKLTMQPLWQELRDAYLSTRAGGALRKRELNKMRDELGGALQLCATGGSHTPAPVRYFMSFMMGAEGNETRVTDAYG
jgi:hypothetical protein